MAAIARHIKINKSLREYENDMGNLNAIIVIGVTAVPGRGGWLKNIFIAFKV